MPLPAGCQGPWTWMGQAISSNPGPDSHSLLLVLLLEPFFLAKQRSDWQRPRQRTFWILQTCLHSWPLNPLLPSAVSTFSLFRFSLLMHQLKLLRALHEPSKLHPSLSLVFPNTNLTWYGNFSKFTFVVCHCFYLLYIMIKKWKVHNLLDLNIKKTILSLYCSIEFYTVIKNNGFIAFNL